MGTVQVARLNLLAVASMLPQHMPHHGQHSTSHTGSRRRRREPLPPCTMKQKAVTAAVMVAVLLAAKQVWWWAAGTPPPPPDPLYRELFSHTIKTLDECFGKHGGRWFAAEGTLLAALRYGAASSVNDDGTVSFVDHDIDYRSVSTSQEQWDATATCVVKGLEAQGWWWCYDKKFYSTYWRYGRLSCEYGGSFLLEMPATHIDLGNFLVDSLPDGSIDMSGYAWTARVKKAGLSKPEWFKRKDGYWDHGDGYLYGGTALVAWENRMPLDVLFPLQTCKLYHYELPCPAKSTEFLEKYNGWDYSGPGCVAFPPHPSESVKQGIRQRAQELHDAGYPSMIDVLHKCK